MSNEGGGGEPSATSFAWGSEEFILINLTISFFVVVDIFLNRRNRNLGGLEAEGVKGDVCLGVNSAAPAVLPTV